MGSIIGHRIDYNGVGALRGQWHKAKINPLTPSHPHPPGATATLYPVNIALASLIRVTWEVRIFSLHSFKLFSIMM